MSNRYEIVQQAGEGGFGRVDHARDMILERNVAIKILDPIFKAEPSPEDKDRFRREAKTLASLSHPNIPAIYDVQMSEEDSDFKIIFEWIDGTTVNKWILEHGAMSLDQVKKWFGNISSVLSHAHSEAIIHRDIKPSNLIITKDLESCYVVDFGIALRQADLDRLTAGSPIGTAGYMSPEQERGEELGPESDIYALAIVLYECLAGFRPTVGEYKQLNSLNEAIPPSVDELILSCLTIDRNKRLKSATEFHRRLIKALLPHTELSETLTQGSLHEIQAAISNMSPPEYANLPAGQRRLILSRVSDLVKVDQPRLRNAVALLLAELVRVSYTLSSSHYSFFVQQGMKYGYEVQFGDQWWGNEQIRKNLNDVIFEVNEETHREISSIVIDLMKNADDLETKSKWYYHDLRILLQHLLANIHCSEELADSIGYHLDRVNEISH